MFYSAQTGGFYVTEIHGNNMPLDVVKISQSEHQRLIDAQAHGKIIIANSNGYPELADRPISSEKNSNNQIFSIEYLLEKIDILEKKLNEISSI